VPSRPELVAYRAEHRAKPLRVPHAFEPLHSSFTLPRWLMRILRTIVHTPAAVVRDPRHHLCLRGGVAPQLVSHHSSRTVAQALEQLAEESFRCPLATPSLYENIEYFPALIDSAPQVDELPR
jgi:hypothetical protein